MLMSIHTSVMLDGRGRSYAPAMLPEPGGKTLGMGEPWDFARLIRYITDPHGGELGLIRDEIQRGGVGRIAMAIDGQETVVYQVTGGHTKGYTFEIENGELRKHRVEAPVVIHASVF